MSPDDFLSAVNKRKFLLIAIVLFFILLSATYSLYEKPTYQASTTLLLTKTTANKTDSNVDYNTVLLNKQLVKTYQELAQSRSIIDEVIRRVDQNLNFAEVKNMVSIDLVTDTELIHIRVENTDPEKAALIANTMSKVFVRQIPHLMKIDNVVIVDEAQKPQQPVKPNIPVNIIIAAIIGFLVGLGIIFILAYLDNSLHSAKDVEKYLGIPNLGTIPQIESESKLTNFVHPHSIAAEAYRMLRTNVLFSNVGKSLQTLLITSASPHEGKSTISANLAITFAQSGYKVIIIDADLRMPTQHKIFKVKQMPGLTNALLYEKPLENFLKTTGISGLQILTTGPLPPNPAELLSTDKMRSIIDDAKKLADIVIIDSAPVVPVTDAAVLAHSVDGTLLVISSGKSKIEITQSAKELLQKSQVRIVGTILNGVRINKSNKYYHYYNGDRNDKKSKK